MDILRGLNKPYEKSLEDIKQFYSKEELEKRAKKKLLGINYLNFRNFEYELDTQKDLYLICTCKEQGYYYRLVIPYIIFGSIRSIGLSALLLDFNSLCALLSSHRASCMENSVQKYGSLILGYYSFEGNRYFAGIVNGELVFLFKVDSHIINTRLYDTYIEVSFGSTKYILELSDYSIRREDQTNK